MFNKTPEILKTKSKFYQDSETEDLIRWGQGLNSFKKQASTFDGLTQYFFTWALGITIIGSFITYLIYQLNESWITLLVAGIVLIIPALSVLIFSCLLVSEILRNKKNYQEIVEELKFRNVIS